MARSAEDRLIEWLRAELAHRGMPDRLGDDAAVLALSGDWAATVDQQIEGIHFRTGLSPHRIGRRLVSVNLSDLAAMGARPAFALATVAAPPDFDFRSFFNGLLDRCEELGLGLAGGDLARSATCSASLTVLGRRERRGRLLRRDLARAGDRLWLGGTVGDSALGRRLLELGARASAKSVRLPGGLAIPRRMRPAARAAVERHLDPRPQLELGTWLATRARAAAIDISDGVALDIERLARASGVDCELDSRALPLAPHLRELAELVESKASELALAGGEDYVLAFALPRTVRPPARFRATAVGHFRASSRGPRLSISGASPTVRGWDHLA